MPRDPQSRPTDDGVQPEMPSKLAPEEMTEPGAKHSASDTDWLSMTTADPAFFLKDPSSD